MNYWIKRQESNSRMELLLRAFFGVFYIGIPHGIMIMIYALGLMFLRIFLFWYILFTGKFHKGVFDYQLNLFRYQARVNARFQNLLDGYPAFGLKTIDENIVIDVDYKESVSRLRMLGRSFFGALLIFPHAFVLIFRIYATIFVLGISFWVILFIGKLPQGMFNFITGLGRWIFRIQLYLYFYTDNYPAFTGKVLDHENQNISGDFGGNSNPELLDA